MVSEPTTVAIELCPAGGCALPREVIDDGF
jgi:hypothetical protein